MLPRTLLIVLVAGSICGCCCRRSSPVASTRPWTQAGERRPPPQEIAQESDRQYDPITRMFVRTGRQWHNDQPPEGYTF